MEGGLTPVRQCLLYLYQWMLFVSLGILNPHCRVMSECPAEFVVRLCSSPSEAASRLFHSALFPSCSRRKPQILGLRDLTQHPFHGCHGRSSTSPFCCSVDSSHRMTFNPHPHCTGDQKGTRSYASLTSRTRRPTVLFPIIRLPSAFQP